MFKAYGIKSPGKDVISMKKILLLCLVAMYTINADSPVILPFFKTPLKEHALLKIIGGIALEGAGIASFIFGSYNVVQLRNKNDDFKPIFSYTKKREWQKSPALLLFPIPAFIIGHNLIKSGYKDLKKIMHKEKFLVYPT